MTDYFTIVKPTYIEAWPRKLLELSMPSIQVPLSLEEARALGRNISEWGEAFGKFGIKDAEILDRVEGRLHKAVVLFRPDGAFVRLGSRSPKDAWTGIREGFNALSGKRAIAILSDCSERMHDDLKLALHAKYAPSVWVRQFIPNLGHEFRCFVCRRKLVAATQYDKKKLIPVADEGMSKITAAIVSFVVNKVIPASHLEKFVVDVAVSDDFSKVTMVEINPFFEYTDPILFDWSKPDEMDSKTIRFVADGGCIISKPLRSS